MKKQVSGHGAVCIRAAHVAEFFGCRDFAHAMMRMRSLSGASHDERWRYRTVLLSDGVVSGDGPSACEA